MENTEELEIDVDDIGAILKSNRLKNKKSLEDVSAELCIRKIYLTALEEGDYETLPPIPYGIGYVRTYANYLGLSSERAVKLYKAASIVEDKKEEEIVLAPEVNKSNNRHLILGILALFLVYGSWYGINSISTSNNKYSSQEVAVVEELNVSKEKIEKTTQTLPIVEEPNKEALIDEIKENITPKGEAKENTLEEKAKENNEISKEEKEEAKETLAPVQTNNVEIKFMGESWVELKNKDKVYFQGVFHKGDVKSVNYVPDMFISVGRPVNVEIYVKGVKKNLLAKRRKTNIPVDSLE